MSPNRIEHFQPISATPAVPFLVHAWADMLSESLCDPNMMWMHHDDGAVVAYAYNQPVGAISYAWSDWDRTVYIRIGYVERVSRGQGIYRQMWEQVVEAAKMLGAARIISATKIGNRPMRAVAAKLGRHEEQVTLVYRLPDDLPKKPRQQP